ncbi:MAG: hypothetical protein OXD34_01360 [bacterium]|nr:hypothetical protein [bacterium]
MVTRERRETTEEFEARLQRQQEEVEAGAYDDVLAENVRYLERQLPDGYVLDGSSRIVRLDPTLPDHVFVTVETDGVPSGRVRIPTF